MNKSAPLLYSILLASVVLIITLCGPGCAQIGMPTGGPKDTIPPHLLNASPALNTVNFTGNKISLTFDEYINIDDPFNNVVVSPFPKNQPNVDYKLKTVTVKLKDSLRPNTTYSINFGNTIKDNNEGNILRNFTYTFSTGDHIDSLSLSGKVILAETGKADSTLVAYLYKDANDSSVQKRRPDFIAKLKGDGSFSFHHLPPGTFNIYALKDGDGSKTYNAKIEMFAFDNQSFSLNADTPPITLYAYAQERDTRSGGTAIVPKPSTEKKLKYVSSTFQANQELTGTLDLSFNRPLKKIDLTKIILMDTNYHPVPATILTVDSTHKKISLKTKWQEDTNYRLLIDKDAVTDSADVALPKSDTLRFATKKESEYGNVVLHFANLDLAKHPVLQFIQNDEVKFSFPLSSPEWANKLFTPGEYELHILLDDNNNGKWDPGNYSLKLQPEKVIVFPQKLAVKADWDNERDIKL